MSDRLRTALVGLGHMGRLHARTIHAHPQFQLVACHDRSEERCADIARRYAVAGTRAPEQLLSFDPELVVVATSTGSHAELAAPLLAAGVAVLVEKPIDATVAQALVLRAAAERSGAPLLVNYTEFFHPAVAVVDALVRAGELGVVESVAIRRVRPPLAQDRGAGSGALWECFTHDAYHLLHWFLPAAPEVGPEAMSEVSTHEHPGPTVRSGVSTSGTFRLGGIAVVFEVGWAAPEIVRTTRFLGSKGSVAIDYLSDHLVLNGRAQALPGGGKDNITRVYDAVAGRLLAGVPYPISIERSISSMRLCEQLARGG